VVEYLNEHDANINTRDRKKFTPLHCAVFANSLEIVKLLIKLKVDVDALDVQKMTPFKYLK
jgi:ankyrin repeat protein